MLNVRKFALVPEEIANQIVSAQRQQTDLVQDTPISTLTLLDRKLKQILENTNLPPDVKAKEYAQVLHLYTGIRDKAVGRTQLAVAEPAYEPDLDFLTGISMRYRNKARMLIKHVEENPDLAWNEKGEILYKGNLVPNSNIIDLVHTAVKPGVSVPTGAPEFTRALREHNIPKTALSSNAMFREVAVEVPPVRRKSMLPKPIFKARQRATTRSQTKAQRGQGIKWIKC